MWEIGKHQHCLVVGEAGGINPRDIELPQINFLDLIARNVQEAYGESTGHFD